jgi:ABC-type cobalamin/Fe3+-siderophores transport system ATPase subunit
VMHSYARRMYRPLRDHARQAGRVSRAMARAERVAAVLAEDAVLEERPGAFHGGRASGELTLERVSFSYGDRPVLRDLSLRIRAGERIAVVGESGAGKSTLAALIARFYDPAEGRVVLDGRDARDCSAAWYRDQVGLVLQETVLFSGTVADNIAYGVAAEPGDIVAVAQAAGADAFIDRLPRGYETELGPRGAALSGGERQRIAIARALLRDPAVLLLDEPTSGLDSESEARVLAGLDVLMRGRTTVIITHSPALAACAERIVALDDGRVVREPARRNGAPRRSPNPPAPLDPALPGMATLLDPDAMGVVLQRTLGTRSAPAVRVHYLRYKPRTNLVVHYEVGVPSEWHHATAMIASRDFLARRAGKPENVALAREAAARASAPEPLAYDAAVGAMIQWLPLDIALPALAAPADQLCTALRAGGVQHASPSGEPELLAYKPRKRAVLRLGDHVLKIYAKEADFERAAGGLRAATGARGVTTASFEGSLRALKVTAQRVVDGRQVTDGIGTAAPSGDVIARLHASGATGLAIALPAHQLAAAVTSARLVKTVAPAVSAQVVRLVGRLAESLPDANSLVPSHGDYSPHQLLDVGGDLALIDCDEFCAAPAALDLATYASYLVRGEPHGLHATWDAIDALLNGYGREPDAFRWYLATSILRRAPAPFRRQEDGWPNRVEAMVATAETALAR